MDILLQKDLEHQEYAVHAVCDVFDNVAFSVPPFYYMNPFPIPLQVREPRSI